MRLHAHKTGLLSGNLNFDSMGDGAGIITKIEERVGTEMGVKSFKRSERKLNFY